jgi:GGDEF domain-containing protein
MLLPETDAKGAGIVARRAIDAVAALQIRHAASAARDRITLSVGGSWLEFWSLTTDDAAADSSAPAADAGAAAAAADDLLVAAEHALADAKSAGGEQVRLVDVTEIGRPELSDA